MTIDTLQAKNPHITIHTVHDDEFRQYGRVLSGFDTQALLAAADAKGMPSEGSLYEPSTPAFESLPVAEQITRTLYGGLPTQLGYCYGHSNRLNALEWHTSSEINIATRDLILLLADVRALREHTVDSAQTKAFLLRRGDMIEVYATTLHFCPYEVNKEGFGCIVALPVGTNTPLDVPSDDPYLFRKNKWLIAHNDNITLQNRGVVAGISGDNIEIKY